MFIFIFFGIDFSDFHVFFSLKSGLKCRRRARKVAIAQHFSVHLDFHLKRFYQF